MVGRRGALVLAVGFSVVAACSTTDPSPGQNADRAPVATARPGVSAPTSGATRTTGTAGTKGTGDTVPPAGVALSPLWRSPAVDGAVYARPVISGNVVIVATENNSLYGFDLSDGHLRWGPTHIGNAVHLADLVPQGKPAGCGNIDPLGITGAPAIDPSTQTGYVVAEVSTAASSPPSHVFAAFDVNTGQLRGDPRSIDPSGAKTIFLQQRPALLFANGFVYVGLGGLFGDCGDYHGWLVAVPVSGGAPRYYEVAASPDSPNDHAGAIWAPVGPAIDDQGHVYVATGNSFDPPDGPNYDRGDAVISLTPTLDEVGFFAPATWRDDNDRDLDLGSTSPVLLPGNRLVQVGKSGTAYLVPTNAAGGNPLGGVGGQLASVDACSAYGGGVYREPFVYMACTNGLHAIRVEPTGSKLEVAWRVAANATGPPVVDGATVWSADPAGKSLYGFDATSGSVVAQQQNLGTMTRFTTPTVSGHTLVIAAGDGIQAFSTES